MTAPTLADEARRLVEYVTSTDRADAEEVVLAALEEIARRTAEDEREKCATIARRVGDRYRGARKADRRDGWMRDRLSACIEVEAAIRAGKP